MNWIDAAIIVILILYILDGYRRGFVEIMLELISFLVAIGLALRFDGTTGNFIAAKVSIPVQMNKPIGFFAIWIIVQVLFSIAIRFGDKFIPTMLRKSKANKFVGIAPSLVKGYVLISIILIIIMTTPISGGLKGDVSNSAIGSRLVDKGAVAETAYDRYFGGVVNNTVTFLTVNPPTSQILEPNERLYLGFKTTDVTEDSAAEQKMFNLVNDERETITLSPLKFDPELQKVARAHALDMFANGYFSHTNLQGESPFDRMQKAGITFKIAGENLALAPNVDLAHNGLMNSPGHRANILDPKYGRVGIGVINGGPYGEMFVQEFRD